MKKKKLVTPLLGQMFKRIAPRIGAKVLIEPEWGIVGQITFKNNKKRYFRYSSLDLNSLGASEIAKDKDYANYFMKRMGYPTILGKTFFSKSWAKTLRSQLTIDAGYRYAKKIIGFPVIVKPNSGSQGNGVALVHNKREFYCAMRYIFGFDRVALVQKPVSGKDYRIVVVDDKVISAYERHPLQVQGNGKSTIRELLKKKQKHFIATSRDTQLRIADPRILEKLTRQRLKWNSIPAKGQYVCLLDNANLSTGGDSVDVTKKIHPEFQRMAVRLTQDMGLRMCGVDVMVEEGSIAERPKKYWILEVNSAPGLDHYAKSGKAQEKIVEKLYLEVMKSMQR